VICRRANHVNVVAAAKAEASGLVNRLVEPADGPASYVTP
jgi:hypothetical protein